MIEVGDEFCNSNSSELENSMRQLTIKYFESYHASKLEELRIFLENESWTQCPVRSKFNLTHLQVNCLKGEGISFFFFFATAKTGFFIFRNLNLLDTR